jgi:hypothetical protein
MPSTKRVITEIVLQAGDATGALAAASVVRTSRESILSALGILCRRGIFLAQRAVMDIKETNPSVNIPKQQPDAPLGDRGTEKTWEPPQDKQGISNREGDVGSDQNREPKQASSEEGAVGWARHKF